MQTVKKLLVTIIVLMLFVCGNSFYVLAVGTTELISAQEQVTEEPDRTYATSEPVEIKDENSVEDTETIGIDEMVEEAKATEENKEIEVSEAEEKENKAEVKQEKAKETTKKEEAKVESTKAKTTEKKTSTKEKKTTTVKTSDNTKTSDSVKTSNKVTKKPSYSKKELRLLASLIYTEAGNQSYEGMLAVANVVLNRVKSPIYWHVDTISEVIYDKKWSIQFAVTKKSSKTGLSVLDKALKLYDTGKFTGANAKSQEKSMNKAMKAAKAALEGDNNIGNYLCFQNKRSATSIKKKYTNYKIIGDHIFYRTK